VALRQVRGILVGTYAQEEGGPVALNYFDEAPTTGRVSLAGLITAPLTTEPVSIGDPVIDSVAILQGGRKSIDTPIDAETREASKQDPAPLPGWLILAAALLAI